ncbi:MAG: aldo/keto reductase, partial [Planctomycetota bacterium]
KHVSARQIADIVNAALDEGITSIDTARAYGNAEEGVGPGLGLRRKEVFLGTKVYADTVEEAEKSLSQSLKVLATDHFDALYLHNLGVRKIEGAMGPKGVFTWLLKQKKAGTARFVGISGHNLPKRFLPFIESGELDVVLINMNFVDRHIYGFEKEVLPAAKKANVGVLAMKVFGGPRGGFPSYEGPKVPPQVGEKHMELAIRYALGLPGVASVNIGVHEPQQVRKNVEMVKNYRPLSPDEHALLAKVGRRMAPELGPRFGPVAEEAAAG